jgi:SpoIID/LytB domain protein
MLSWRTARRMSGITTALVVLSGALMATPAHADGTEVSGRAPGAIAAPTVSASPEVAEAPEAAETPVAPAVDVTTTAVPPVPAPEPETEAEPDVEPSEPAPTTDKLVAELPPTSTDGFGMVGVTWASGATTGVQVEIRTRTDGVWSEWTDLGVEDNGEGGVPGTEPWWVGEADGVAARVTSQSGALKDVKISTIDAGETAADPTDDTADGTSVSGASWSGLANGVATATTAAVEGSPTYTAMPTIITRSAWGASAGTPCDTPAAGDRTRGVVVHHTAGTNTYTKAQSASIVRATQAFHVKSRKWCDLGYNFLVDKYGQIFEGRRGGMDRAVRAAHSGNGPVNTYTMGVSMMGNYDLVKPTTALKDSMVKLIGWRMGTTFLKAKGTYSLGGKTLNMIAGHRDVLSTACPGRYGYAWLSESGGLRDRVETYLAAYSTPIKTLYGTLGAAKVGAIFVGEARTSTGARLRGALMDLYSRTGDATARAVGGTIRTEYDRVGGRTGALGYPVGDAVAVTGGTRQAFDGGYVTTVGGKAVAYTNAGAVITGKGGTPPAPAPAPVAKPATVSKVSVKAGRKSARLTWPAVAGATSYDVCLYATKTNTSCNRVATGVTARTVLMTKLKATRDTDWYAKVRAVTGTVKGDYSRLKGFNLATGATASSAGTSGAPTLKSSVTHVSTTTTSSGNTTTPSNGRVTIEGHGYGHGIGMSQYGAQGAARQGVLYDQILATYYPGTTLAKKSGSIRVLVSQDTSDAVDVQATSGLVFRKLSSSYRKTLPTSIGGAKVRSWRIVRVSSRKTQSMLQYRTSGSYRGYKSIRWTGDGQFEGPSKIGLLLPGGSVVKYRGVIRSAVPSKGSTARDTVNVLPIEHYVRGVIAAEMPAGWAAEALKAQAVAARTYGVRSLAPSRYYDICSTTACQVYGGASRETPTTDAAARATSGQFVSFQGGPALTQFSSSSGGRTSAGSQPYLVAGDDPYDGWSGNANHDWTTSVAASTIQKAYPAIGTLQQLTITKRTGGGSWGGRVSSIQLIGSNKTVTITGNDARWAFGLKSNWFGF